jgi:hypothetical protein
MSHFDTAFKQIYKLYNITEADASMLPPAGGPAGAPQQADTAQQAAAPAPAAAPNLPAVSPEDNIQDSDPNATSKLTSQKKVQLIKLIALALATRSPQSTTSDSPDNKLLHKLRVALQGKTTEGNVNEKEQLLIKGIAHLQGVDAMDISTQVKYITPSFDPTMPNRYIPEDQYAQLIELARKALLANTESIGDIDRSNISASDITAENADEKLKSIKSILAQIF